MELITLTEEDCWSLLGPRGVGRVGYSDRALPVIVPLGYTVVGQRIMIRCKADSLAQRLDGQVVAFEVDHVDVESQGGWSVLVTGTCRRLSAAGELLRATTVPPSWAGPDHQALVAITPGKVEGRRIVPGAPDVVSAGSGAVVGLDG